MNTVKEKKISALQLDDQTRAIYLKIPGPQVVLLQAIFELYEGPGTILTLDIRRGLICILTTNSMMDLCRKILHEVSDLIQWEDTELPADIPGDPYLGYTKKGLPEQSYRD